MLHTCYAGCDVSLQWLDLCILVDDRAQVSRYPNSPEGQAEVRRALAAQADTCLVVEASGGYETGLLEAFWQSDAPVALVEAGRVRAFARALARLAKTDRIDAEVIARFGLATRPAPVAPPDVLRKDLRGLVDRRRALVKMRSDEKRRLKGLCRKVFGSTHT